MEYQKTFDEELEQILTDYRNQSWIDPETGQPLAPLDTAQGSLVFIKASVLASAKWGLHQHQSWIARQIFPDLADSAKLEHHCWLRGIYRQAGETDAELLERLLTDLREPAAGGNQADYVRWAKQVDNVASAWCVPLGNGIGTVDVLILADAGATGAESPSTHTGLSGTTDGVEENALVDSAATFITAGVAVGDIAKNSTQGTQAVVTALASETQLTLDSDIFAGGEDYEIVSLARQVHDYISALMPCEMHADDLRILAPTILVQDVTMTIPGAADPEEIAADITAFMNTMTPGQSLYVTRLVAFAIVAGEEIATVTTPADTVTATASQVIRPGVIDVSIA